MTAVMGQIGPIEASLRQRAIDIRRRFARMKPPPVKMLEPPAMPVSPFQEPELPPETIKLMAERKQQVEKVRATLAAMAPWRRVVDEVAAKHELRPSDITGKSRTRPVIIARHEACYRMVVQCKMALAEAGKRITVDHTTVLHGVRQHIKRNPELSAEYAEFVASNSTTHSSIYRDVIRMYFMENRSVPDVMHATGLDRNMVNSFIRSEVRRVREAIAAQEAGL